MTKKITVFCLFLLLPCFLLGFINPITGEFSDLDNHWAEKEINTWARQGLVSGYPDGSFRPDAKLSRAEFVALINRAFGFSGFVFPEFTDVSLIEWYTPDICTALSRGYINGYPDGTFRPNQAISRQEIAAILVNILALPKTESTIGSEYRDFHTIPFWSLYSFQSLIAKEYLGGYPDGTLQPTQALTRAEAISILDRVIGKRYDQDGIFGPTLHRQNVTILSSLTLKNTIIKGDVYLSPALGDEIVILDNVIIEGTLMIAGGNLQLSPETEIEDLLITSPTTISGEGTLKKVRVESPAVVLEINPEHLEVAEGITDLVLPEPPLNLTAKLISTDSSSLKYVFTTEYDCTLHYLLLPRSASKPTKKDFKELQSLKANEKIEITLRSLSSNTTYKLYYFAQTARQETEIVEITAATKRRSTTTKKPTIVKLEEEPPVYLPLGTTYQPPETVVAHFSDGTVEKIAVVWETEIDSSQEGEQIISGKVVGFTKPVNLTLCYVSPTESLYQVTIETYPSAGGIVKGMGKYPADVPVTVKAIPYPDFTFLNWSTAETELTTDTVYQFTMRSQPLNLIANFKMKIDTTLKEITLANELIPNFDPTVYTYTIKLPFGTPIPPQINAIPTDPQAVIEIIQAQKLTDPTTIHVTARDGKTTESYVLRFEVMEEEIIAVTGISLNKQELTLAVENEETLTANVEPTNASNKAVIWESSNKEVANVDENGKVTAVKAGEVTITVTTVDGGYEAACNVTVVEEAYTVTFETDGGSEIDEQIVKHGNKVDKPTDPTKEGHSFVGWYKDEELNTAWDFDEDTVTEDITLYAKWTVNQYTITFNSAGGSTVASITEDYDTAITAPANPTREGYDFNGWSPEIPKTMPAKNMTVTAQWKAIEYTITYELNGGTNDEENPETYTIETETITLKDATKVGYTIEGWYDTETGGNKVTQIEKGSTGDKTLYARWEPCTNTVYKVKHYQQDVTGDGYTLKDTENLSGTTDTTVTATAKTYNGFTENTEHTNRVASGTIKPDGSLVLELYYDRNTYTVSFESNGGSSVSNITVRYGAIITEPENPTKEGHSFVGWYKDEELNTAWDFDEDTVTENIILYAKWEEIKVTGVSLNKSELTLAVEGEETLTVAVEPEDAFNKNVTWSSNNEKVATVDGNGVVTAVAEGNATITVTTEDGAKTATCTVTVVIPITKITITVEADWKTVEKDKTLQMEVTVEPSDATNETVIWSIDEIDIAKIDKEGLLTGLAAGTVTVEAIAKDGFGAKDTYEVTVVEPVGARWEVELSTKMERLGAAVECEATGCEAIGEFFDEIYPYSEMKLCNVADDGKVNAYIGDKDKDGNELFLRDGSNGQVMVEIPKFYYKHTWNEDVTEHEFWVADKPIEGYKLHPCFIRNGEEIDCVYMGAYMASEIEEDDKIMLASISGSLPAVSRKRAVFREQAQKRGTGWEIVDALSRNAVSLLYLVEYADTNCQTVIGRGIVDLRYSENDKVTAADENDNQITVSATTGAHYQIGEIISVGTNRGGQNVCKNRKIINKKSDAGNIIITVDGEPFSTTEGDILYHVGQRSGGCDTLDGASGGAPKAHDGTSEPTNGRVSVSYRGLEDLWGNVWEFIDGINIKNIEKEYGVPYIADHDFEDDVFDNLYQSSEVDLPEGDGYCKNFAASEAADWLLMPSKTGGSSSTYIPDYYYQNWSNEAHKVALVGGRWYYTSLAGLFSWRVNHLSFYSSLCIGARPLYLP